jgi:hypothetical protein
MLRRDTIQLTQKGQGAKIDIINPKAADRAQRYMEQRARGAYIASICQPEASFHFSAAAQIQQPTDKDYGKLNHRLHWQAENLQRGLRYIPLDLATAKLMVEQGKLDVVYTPTADMVADGMTKPLQRAAFERFENQLDVIYGPDLS